MGLRTDSPPALVRGLMLLAAFAAAALLLPESDDPVMLRRQLDVSPGEDTYDARAQAPPASLPAVPTKEDPLTVNVYSGKGVKYSSNVFETDIFARFGSGRVEWNLKVVDPSFKTDDRGPCLALGHHKGKKWHVQDFRDLAARFPHCMYMNHDDEKCKAPDQFDFRQYRSERLTGFYVPLSMRFDAWTKFQSLKKEEGFALKKPSSRKYAFNAMMSLSTSWERQSLAKMLRETEEKRARAPGKKFEAFLSLTEHWTAAFDTRAYLEVVLDSVFTLAPRGHHPECFRLYEAIEAGSIPVLIKEDLATSKCKNSMYLWYEAPMLYLNDWEELYPTVEMLMKDPEKLDRMYKELREWYEGFMEGRIQGMEDAVIDRYFGDKKEKVEAIAEK